jgi:tetratricopeptide (TPR) repeat protein
MSFMKLNENSKAVRDCDESIRYDPMYIKSYLRRGECHKKLGSYLESLADFKKVKELDPKDKDVDAEISKL